MIDMQITETLNDQQRLMSLADKQMLRKCYPIFNEIESEGYDVEFYYVDGFGGLTIVPSVNRVRVKVSPVVLSHYDDCLKFAHKVRQSFESRLTNPNFWQVRRSLIVSKQQGKISCLI
ncbi:botulinum neurotoxin type D, BoNT/D [Salmonella phage 40]|nr:botulinum neurotoxin type D, BoNT/D [Salmonella phage 40]